MKAALLAGAVCLALAGPSNEASGQATTAEALPQSVVAAERAWAGADVLLPLAHAEDRATAVAAIRALGRLQDRALVDPLLDLENSGAPDVRAAAAAALAQTLIAASPRADGALLTKVVDAMLQHGDWRAAARLAMPDAPHASAVETFMLDILKRAGTSGAAAGDVEGAVRGFESLARRNARLAGFALRPESIAVLQSAVVDRQSNGASPVVRRYAVWTLVEAHAASAAVLRAALHDPDDQTRRITVQALGGNGSGLEGQERTRALENALTDPSVLVRVEAARSYAKTAAANGDCAPLIAALRDGAPHVVNVTLDALATACPGDDEVTTRLAQEATAPSASGTWQPAAHALVALAARDRSKAAAILPAFVAHPVWEVRMYAARAAELVKDEPTLARLAMDPSDNVRSAALPPLHGISAERARPAVRAALERADNQVLRTAATLLGKEPPSREAAGALSAALQRISRERKQTTRDARLALLDALAKHGSAADADTLVPLLSDADARVAARAAEMLRQWGRGAQAAPAALRHDERQLFRDPSTCVAIEMESGRRMRLRPDPEAPVTSDAFLHLALDRHFYDGRTFHRVEPDFVIQGGSPGANEYSSGLDTFMRDEIGVPNARGGVGLSTRGLDTADGQIYILLVDEPRLDGRYTIFAHVFDSADDMRTLDGIQEGDRIARIARTGCPRN